MQNLGSASRRKWIDTFLFSDGVFWNILPPSMSTNASSATQSPVLSTWLLLSCTAVNLYLLGAACLLQVVAYPLLGAAGNDALPALHAALTHRLGVVFILPEFLAFGLVLPLFYWRPPTIRISILWACLALGIVYFGVTFAWHLPAHKLLALGDASAMPALLVSHAVRTTSVALKCGLLVWLLRAREA